MLIGLDCASDTLHSVSTLTTGVSLGKMDSVITQFNIVSIDMQVSMVVCFTIFIGESLMIKFQSDLIFFNYLQEMVEGIVP